MWVLLFMAGIKGPLYRVLAVQNHPQVSAEMLGVPMTILANVLVKSPESLDEEAREFCIGSVPRNFGKTLTRRETGTAPNGWGTIFPMM